MRCHIKHHDQSRLFMLISPTDSSTFQARLRPVPIKTFDTNMADAVSILERNLAALGRTDPTLAQTLRQTAPLPLEWLSIQPSGTADQHETSKALWSATVTHEGKTLSLASRYDPFAEARQINKPVDFTKQAGAVVLGVGLGYHVLELAQRAKGGPVVIVYEPDPAMLRAVLQRIDHTAWLGQPNIVLFTGEVERAAILTRIEIYSSLLTQGTILLHHPPTRRLHADRINQFSQSITDLLNYFRVHIATALVNSTRTIENLTSNLAHYAAGPSTQPLYQIARGYPAVCVSAGPSLAKNIDLLRDPEVRRNIVLITTQTTLRPLVDRGIRPDFVTALDYHEISRRFYENLPPMEGVTLVVEAKGHPSILENYPGPMRVVGSPFLDRFLGPAAPDIRPIKQGATVAHLSFYLAQHLGCNPVMFIGQDLGFSDGLYYCPGTAIHEVWAPELSPWNTLEMMEWQRIVRHRGHLRKLPDIHGRDIYTDEQMTTYLEQFERDFADADETIIDATEGGLPKKHSTRMSLREALAQHATRPVPKMPLPERTLDAARLHAAIDQLHRRTDDLHELRKLTRETIPLLRDMAEVQHDQKQAHRLFEKIEERKRKVAQLGETFNLINDLNTIGVYKRARADRIIEHQTDDDPFAKQRRQIERDIENLQWLLQAFDEAGRIFQHALQRLQQHVKTVVKG